MSFKYLKEEMQGSNIKRYTMNTILISCKSAYYINHSYENALPVMMENWRNPLYDGQYVGALLKDRLLNAKNFMFILFYKMHVNLLPHISIRGNRE